MEIWLTKNDKLTNLGQMDAIHLDKPRGMITVFNRQGYSNIEFDSAEAAVSCFARIEKGIYQQSFFIDANNEEVFLKG